MNFGVTLALAILGIPNSSGSVAAGEDVIGPLRLCLKYSTFDLAEGERVVDVAGSMENIRLTIDTPDGRLVIDEGEILADRHNARRPFRSRTDARIYARRGGGYTFYGRPAYSISGEPVGSPPPEDSLVATMSGAALESRSHASGFLERLRLGAQAENCGRRYLYGWEYMFQEDE
jgi:hypothetical protein